MSAVLLLGILSGIIQVIGYLFYFAKTKRSDISPNPTTWLIFAGDTSLLALLEFIAGAELSLLILPVTCAFCSLYVAYLLRRSGKLGWPHDGTDKTVLMISLLIASLYTYVFILWEMQYVAMGFLLSAGIVFLVLSNLNTFVAFVPVTREVYHYPEREHAGPWTIWTAAYTLLAVVTYLEVGFELSGLIFYLYPVSCAVLHGIIALLSLDVRKRRRKYQTSPGI